MFIKDIRTQILQITYYIIRGLGIDNLVFDTVNY